MGTDIHSIVEVKKKRRKKWKVVGKDVKVGHYELPRDAIDWKHGEWWEYNMHKDGIDDDGQRIIEPLTHQNYHLFAMLANIRNGNGAGDIIPISTPKGVPKDASVFYQNDVRSWGIDGHSHSWLTVAEIENWLKDIDNNFTCVTKNDRLWRKHCEEILTDLSDELKQLAAHNDVDDVRIVFFFDN